MWTPISPQDRAVAGLVVVGSSCWSCEGVTTKYVPWRNRRHGHFQWSCSDCDVSWSGPGEPV